jgi:hypothetical protein
MVNKKDLIIAVLATFCLTATLFLIIPTRSQTLGPYDPWLDTNADGKIDGKDLGETAFAFGSYGDPTKYVNVSNWIDPTIPIIPIDPPVLTKWYIYSAPFIVSYNPPGHPSDIGLGPGVYETDILVHNPSGRYNVNVSKKIVVAYREWYPFDNPRPIGNLTLTPDAAFRIDSVEIKEFCPPGNTTVKGFVCIITNYAYLDVIAFYTVSDLSDTMTYSIESLTIAPKPWG